MRIGNGNYHIYLQSPDTGYVLLRAVYGQWVRVGIFDTYALALAAAN